MSTRLILIATFAVFGLLSCGKPRVGSGVEIGRNGEILEQGPRIEVVWVDPTIVETDQQMTLIRSNRVDSIEISRDEIRTPAAPAISFEIADKSCWTSISMLDSRGRELESLLHRQLEPGFYKMTLHKPPPAANPNVPYNYSLQVRFCGRLQTVQIGTGKAGGF